MSLDPNTLCPGCFSPTHPSPVCSQCGVSVKARRPAGTMPLWTRLDGERYLIGHVLGQGGFGITYASWDQTLMQRVAVKELFPRTSVARTSDGLTVEPGTDAEVVAFEEAKGKFLEEARLLARPSLKQHPGIITVENFFEACGTAYLVMEYLEGQTLEEYVDSQKGRLPYEVTAAMMDAVLDALEAVHSERLPDGSVMVHRDIKPQNLYLTHAGVVKLLDFGAARFAGGQSDRSATAMGTEGYAALEQYQRKTQGPWTDIYATAATWYRVLAGRTPMAAVERLGEVPDPLKPPSAHGADVPEDVEAIWLKALAVLPQDRWASVEELQSALQQADQPESIDDTTTPEIEPGRDTDSTAGPEDAGSADLPPDEPPVSSGKRGKAGRTVLWTLGSAVAVFAAYLLYGYIWEAMYSHLHESEITAMTLSSDQSEVFSTSFGIVKQWSLADGELIQSFEDEFSLTYDVAVSPDGRYMASAGTAGLQVWGLESGKIERELGDAALDSLYKQKSHTGAVRRVAFSPDSITAMSAGEDGALMLWDLNNGRIIATYQPEAPVTSIAFSPDGRRAVTGSREGKAQLWNTATRFLFVNSDIRVLVNPMPNIIGSLATLASIASKPLRTFDTESSTVIAFAPDGQSLASGGKDGLVVIWDINTGESKDFFTGHDYAVTALAYNEDGSLLASGDMEGYIRARRPDSGDEAYAIAAEEGIWFQPIVSLQYIDYGGLVFSNGKKVHTADAQTGAILYSFPVSRPERLF